MTTKKEMIETLGKCAVCDFQRQGNICIQLGITIPEEMKKNGCLKFQWERA